MDLPVYYQEADIFVFPTLGEGFGLVVLEAMSAGLGVICSQNAGGNDVISEYQNGFIYDPLDEQELKKYILWCADNKEKIMSFGEESKKIAKNYTWDKYYSAIFTTIDKVIK